MNTGFKIALAGIGGFLVVKAIVTNTVDTRMFRLGNTTTNITELRQVIAYFEARGKHGTANILRPRLAELEGST